MELPLNGNGGWQENIMELWNEIAGWIAGNWTALVGYGASVVILISLVTTNVLRLRLVNGIGSMLFGWYGLLIGSWPVCIINWIIAGMANIPCCCPAGVGDVYHASPCSKS